MPRKLAPSARRWVRRARRALGLAGQVAVSRVVLGAPSQTTVWLGWTPSNDPGYAGWTPIVDLDGPGHVSGGARGIAEVSPGVWETTFLSPPGDPGAEWRVSVGELVGFRPGEDQPAQRCQGLDGPCELMTDGTRGQRRITGPWVLGFRFPHPGR